VLETVIRVLEQAADAMQVREIHAAAEQLAGKPLLWKSVKAALAVNAEGEEARFERVRRGFYRIKERRPAEYEASRSKRAEGGSEPAMPGFGASRGLGALNASPVAPTVAPTVANEHVDASANAR